MSDHDIDTEPADGIDSREIERLDAEVARLTAERDRLRSAIIEHRDQRGDDRCWLDDLELYRTLGDDGPSRETDLRLPPKCDFLQSCARYWEQRQHPRASEAPAPGGMTMAQLQAEVERLQEQKSTHKGPYN